MDLGLFIAIVPPNKLMIIAITIATIPYFLLALASQSNQEQIIASITLYSLHHQEIHVFENGQRHCPTVMELSH